MLVGMKAPSALVLLASRVPKALITFLVAFAIADELGVGVGTVNTYVRHIYEKLHVRSRAEAVAKLAGRW